MAIVLPTRYGKSNYIRMTGLYLLHQGAVSGVMVMTPSRVLRNQMVNDAKLAQRFRWYETKLERSNSSGERVQGIFPYNMAKDSKDSGQRIHGYNHLDVSYYLETIVHWIDYPKSRYGVYPVIFVDEAHTASNQTRRGKTVEALAKARPNEGKLKCIRDIAGSSATDRTSASRRHSRGFQGWQSNLDAGISGEVPWLATTLRRCGAMRVYV